MEPLQNRAVDAYSFETKIIFEWIEPQSTVLDLGCGEGDLLYLLDSQKGVKGQGIELDRNKIHTCVQKGLSVFHQDIEQGLVEFKHKAFDYIILQQSLTEVVKQPDALIHQALFNALTPK